MKRVRAEANEEGLHIFMNELMKHVVDGSFPTMQHRLALFRSGGVNSSDVVVQPWIVTKQVIRNDILSLPAPVDNTRKR